MSRSICKCLENPRSILVASTRVDDENLSGRLVPLQGILLHAV